MSYKRKLIKAMISEMDQSVKHMLKLIEEDGDSFAKKAEMYYQKRPELISLVEDFYRKYRSLAERYDHVTGELKKNIPSDIQSMTSGMSEIGSELPSACPSPDLRPSRRRSSHRAAGFDYFLGSGGSVNSDHYQKEGDESSSLTDSDTESDVSSVNNYASSIGNGDQLTTRKVIELEIELREVRERLRAQQEENAADGSLKASRNDMSEDLLSRIAAYEQDLRNANEKLQLSKEEIDKLQLKLLKYKTETPSNELSREEAADSEIQDTSFYLELETLSPDDKTGALLAELRITKERLKDAAEEIKNLKQKLENSEKISSLQDQLEAAKKDAAMSKSKMNAEKREVLKLQERVMRLKSSLQDRDHEIMDLKLAVSDAEEKIFPEKAQIKAEISGLLEERKRFEEQIRELESRGRFLEEDIRRIKAEKTELKTNIAERVRYIQGLNESIETLKSEKDKLSESVVMIKAEVSSRDERIKEMDKHLHQLHLEHAELIAQGEEARKQVEEMRDRSKEFEEEIERQRVMILEGAEEKREAIRQLCFSLEHYRNGYQMLLQAFQGHNNRRMHVLAS